MKAKSTGKGGSGGWFMMLFALPFAGVGVFMLFLAARAMWTACAVAQWREVPATIVGSELEAHHGKSTGWEAKATYRYVVDGTSYTGSRVSIHSGADNIGDFQQKAYAEIKRHQGSWEPYRCYVNPHDPADSILFRDPRWGMILFKGLFGLVFGGVGFGIMAAAIWARRRAATESAARARHPDEPWLQNPDWASGVIKSSTKLEMIVSMAFAGIWNAIAIPVSVLALGDGNVAHDRARLIVLVFPLAGICLGVWATMTVLRYLKYGNSTFQFSKMPGVIGGPLGGVVQVPAHVKPDDGFHVTLRSVHRYTTGSGRNRNTHEDILWEDERIIVHELSEGDARRSAIPVLFAIPRTCQPTDQENSDDQRLWRLEVTAKTPGPDYAARFEVPVFVTPDSSANFRLDESPIERYERKIDPAALISGSGVKVEVIPGGRRFVFPAARQKGHATWITLFGGIWTGVVVLMAKGGAPRFMTVMFGLVDAVLIWSALMMWMDTRCAEVGPRGVTLKGGILGMGRTRTLRRDEVDSLNAVSGLQAGSQLFFNIQLRTLQGRSYTVGTRIPGRHAADVLAAEIEKAIRG